MAAAPHTRAGPALETARYTRTQLQVTRGPDTGRTVEAAGRTLSIGTAHDSDLVLTDDTVSRRHCEIELTEAGFRVRDLGSTNGLHCGGMRIYAVECTTRTELQLGETTLTVTPLSQTEDRSLVTADRFGDLLGSSRKMRALFAELERLAPTQLSILIEGETGTGKDVAAESIHHASERAQGPYVVFDCSAVAPTLIESELFGHERGAFTGAVQARAGVFEEAHGGSLFLDEIGELPKDLQPKLLRALEKRQVKRLGSQRMLPIDVRIIAATNRNLAAEVRADTFRQDLYYRIAGARVQMPPLRERVEDLPLLVAHFLALDAPKLKQSAISADVWSMFRDHRWPGNVRELRNAVQRLVVAPELSLDLAEHNPVAATRSDPAPATLEPLREARCRAAEAFERAYLRAILDRTQGNVTRAAAIAEVSRQMVQKLMRKYGVTERE
ncbi:MAG: sigma 54-interacting transcriptional regulator [Polyangiales bacterium]